MQRRRFIQTLAATLALPGAGFAGKLFAAPPSSPRFLLVFLRGGYDCANMLVPYSSDFYYETRPNIAIAKPDGASHTGALALDTDWALTPVLRESIGAMYKNKEVAFIPFCGTDDMSRSHFETQDNIELGQSDKPAHNLRSGFLARLSATLNGGSPIAFTDALPLSFQGGKDIPNISLGSIAKPAFDQRQSAILAGMYTENHLHTAVVDGLELRQQVAQEFEQEMQKANRGAINARGFAVESQHIASMMRDRYRIGFVDVGGWDTHVNEGGAQGQLADNLGNLGRGLSAFAQELGDEWKNTVVIVVSEFGRTFRENGNKGTDHGHGSVYWVLGGGINGGRIAGEQVSVEQANLLQNRDYPVINNYRAALGGIYARLWGLSSTQLEHVFPDSRSADLRLV